MITTVNCGLSLQLTRQLVNLSTRKPVNSSTCQQRTTNYANDTNYITISISVIRENRSSYHKVQSSNLNVQRIKIRSRCVNLFYIFGQEKVRNGVENQLFFSPL